MVNTNENFKEYFTEPAELADTRKRLAELLLKAAIPRWLLPSDAGGEMTAEGIMDGMMEKATDLVRRRMQCP